MSRPSSIWVLLWIVLAALGVTVWQALRIPDEDVAEPPPVIDGSGTDETKFPPVEPTPDNDPPIRDDSQDGLLASLPAPQSPPAGLDAQARKQWLDDLMKLIDDASYLGDEASLRMLIVEFRNPDSGIAEAARSSLMARADRKALPYIEEMHALDLNPDKKRQLEELMEFLNKKSVFEHMRSKNP